MDAPTPELLTLLTHLRLASVEQVRRVRRGAVRLAQGLPLFDSIWIDALAQSRLLTAFQAAEFHAGRGAELEVGPFVLCQPLGRPDWAACYLAQDRQTGEKARLAIFAPAASRLDETQRALERLVQMQAATASPGILTLSRCGRHAERLWVASRWFPAKSAQQWMLERGRFAPLVAREIARQVAARLAAWEACGQLHGDLLANQVLLDSAGRVWLCWPGLRNLLRPTEGYTSAELPAECYDHLAPERIALATEITTASEIYACGALWWQLLSGRPPLSGANGLAKLRMCQTARIAAIRDVAPDTPETLATAIEQCLSRDPADRPPSFANLAERLGPSSGAGRRALCRSLDHSRRSRASLTAATRTFSRTPQGPLWLTALAGCAMTILVALWPHLSHRTESPPAALAKNSAKASANAPASNGTSPAKAVDAIQTSPRVPPQSPAAAPASPHGVQLASFIEEAKSVLELTDEQAKKPESLDILEGQTVRGRGGRRLSITTPPHGWKIVANKVRFENVDFVAGVAPTDGSQDGDQPALIHLQAWKASFQGCSFQGLQLPDDGVLPAAIRWDCRASANDLATALPTAELTLGDCAFARVAAAVSHTGSAALVLDVTNSLHLGSGPLVRLGRAPHADEPVAASFSHVTVRGAVAALSCRDQGMGEEPGPIAVHALDCAFVPSVGGSLLELTGEESPARLLQAIEWNGQGCVVPRDIPLAIWRLPQGDTRTAAEETLRMEGLVRTDVGFAGQSESGPAASRIVRWQAPLRSTEPPGIGDRPLSLPIQKPR